MAEQRQPQFVFPRWANYLLPVLVVVVIGAAVYVPTLVVFGLNPDTLAIGYRPPQPVRYSHALHVGELGMDCRYCHSTVENAAFASIPPTQSCIACHNPGEGAGIKKHSPLLQAVHQSYQGLPDPDRPGEYLVEPGLSIPWKKVHDLADYVFFDHSAHVNAGVGCVTCHGRVDRMGEEGVHQVANLSMGWCLDCHRAPERYLRPVEEVMNMEWSPLQDPRVQQAGITNAREAQLFIGRELKQNYGIHDAAYMSACSTCHR